MRKIFYVLMFVFVFGIYPSFAADQILKHIPDAKVVGQGRMSVLLWDVYDATLYGPEGSWSADKPFALKLNYLRKLNGKKIADRSVEEMRGQGFDDEVKLATWHAQMSKIFPDVIKGTEITGVYAKSGESIFYQNDQEIGRIKDPEFSRAFFDIWLNEKTSAPDLRAKLLGAT